MKEQYMRMILQFTTNGLTFSQQRNVTLHISYVIGTKQANTKFGLLTHISLRTILQL